MVHLNRVSKAYFGQPKIFNQIQLQLDKGSFLFVVGGSGAGKSSLLRMIASEERPTDGAVSLFGYDLNRSSSGTLQGIRRALGYVPQDVRLVADLSVFDNVALAVSVGGRRRLNAEARLRIQELLDCLGLKHKAKKPACELSGGEAQRVAIARAIAREPELIIADEPTGAQDQNFTWVIMDLFLKANAKGTTIVVATHDREIVRRVRKPCAVLKQGQLQLETQFVQLRPGGIAQ
jgi:cell division transport system ATP-binding protein